MYKLLLIGISFIVFSTFLSGCNSGTQNVQVQDIVELKWQSDGSAIFGYSQSYISTSTTVIPSPGYSIIRCNNDGSIAQTYNTTQLSRPTDIATGTIDSYAPSLYLSSDGNTIVTQLEGDVYRFHPQTGALDKLLTQFHLITVSPDLRYAVVTNSPDNRPIKTVDVYDLNSSVARHVTNFDAKVAISPGIWLNNGSFAITCNDTSGTNISIYDTTSIGPPLMIISGAETPFHNVVFNSNTNTLYVRNHGGHATDNFVDKINLTTKSRANMLNFAVTDFDVTRDENIIIYSAYDTSHNIHLKSRNLVSSNEISIADDIRLIVALSPMEDKIAYIRQRDANFSEIHVIPFIRP